MAEPREVTKAHRSGERPLTAAQVGELLGLALSAVKRIPAEQLPFFRVGSRGDRRYDRVDVAAYMAARREG